MKPYVTILFLAAGILSAVSQDRISGALFATRSEVLGQN